MGFPPELAERLAYAAGSNLLTESRYLRRVLKRRPPIIPPARGEPLSATWEHEADAPTSGDGGWSQVR